MRLLTWGVIGAVIFGVVRGFQNGTLQQFTKNISDKLNLQDAQQMMQPIQQMSHPLQQMNQSSQQMNQSLQNSTINRSTSNS
ncbi:hypothetical protein ACZ11_03965 [Lysinibacillus xylanilyticus]|uniref:Uncharacterized protein n=1 Tax=Lysinibacillus xylanilyticus TaxID=582475 RepID=A0A0K9FAD7_9BACI|nr:hypothetical protein [Lysinibacillus xylanilyticus]KMY31415.1 hypothetical protein ACZ11_03965 [Lysinibacillus xylanilyticus]